LARWSNAVDRHLKQLVSEATLTKLTGGLSHAKKTVFGKAPAEDDKLVGIFLKDSRFLLASPNAYNSLGVGTTQLYDKTVVYNHKRHGEFSLGGRKFAFRMKPSFPKALTKEFFAGRSCQQSGSACRGQERSARKSKRASSVV
jgi:hypothetical protein